jgi:hypothetical protein
MKKPSKLGSFLGELKIFALSSLGLMPTAVNRHQATATPHHHANRNTWASAHIIIPHHRIIPSHHFTPTIIIPSYSGYQSHSAPPKRLTIRPKDEPKEKNKGRYQ